MKITIPLYEATAARLDLKTLKQQLRVRKKYEKLKETEAKYKGIHTPRSFSAYNKAKRGLKELRDSHSIPRRTAESIEALISSFGEENVTGKEPVSKKPVSKKPVSKKPVSEKPVAKKKRKQASINTKIIKKLTSPKQPYAQTKDTAVLDTIRRYRELADHKLVHVFADLEHEHSKDPDLLKKPLQEVRGRVSKVSTPAFKLAYDTYIDYAKHKVAVKKESVRQVINSRKDGIAQYEKLAKEIEERSGDGALSRSDAHTLDVAQKRIAEYKDTIKKMTKDLKAI